MLQKVFQKFDSKYIKYVDYFNQTRKLTIKFDKDGSVAAKNKNENKNQNLQLKTPKGTKDFHPYQMKIREKLFDTISSCFKIHGAKSIDTPIMELRNILTNKYGEEAKLIYDLKDQQGELLSLRYDLTVPFARYLASNKIQNLKRYQIGKVYRRENLSHAKGRLREFFQCDFDIAGVYDPMVPDSECLKIITEILDKLEFKNYLIKINHKNLLDAIYEICNVPVEKYRNISSSIDKLDKIGWDGVKKLILENEIDENIYDKIYGFISQSGTLFGISNLLRSNESIKLSKKANDALNDLELLFKYCEILKISDRLEFDLSMARGLDYYTGIMFEAVIKDTTKTSIESSVGSLAAGGRYDNLISMLDPKFQVKCVGLSIGIERLYSIMEEKYLNSATNKNKCFSAQVYIAAPQKGLLDERLSLCEELWRNEIRTEFSYKSNGRLLDQLTYCEDNQIPICVIIGNEEIKNNSVKIRNVSTRFEETVKRDELIQELRKRF